MSNNHFEISEVSEEELFPLISEKEPVCQYDLGLALIGVFEDEVTGNYVTISTANGRSVLLKLPDQA